MAGDAIHRLIHKIVSFFAPLKGKADGETLFTPAAGAVRLACEQQTPPVS